MAQGFVTAKLSHVSTLLQRHNRELGDPDIAGAVDQIGQALAASPREVRTAGPAAGWKSGTAARPRLRRLVGQGY